MKWNDWKDAERYDKAIIRAVAGLTKGMAFFFMGEPIFCKKIGGNRQKDLENKRLAERYVAD